MIWLWVAIGVVVLLIALEVLLLGRARGDGRIAGVDPFVDIGLALTACGAVLVTTLGPAMVAVMVAGVIVTAIGARRVREERRG